MLNTAFSMIPLADSPVRRAAFLFIIGFLISLPIFTPKTSFASTSDGGDEFLVVDCLLPGRIKKLGKRVTFLEPRRPIKTSAQDCEIRGGEYVAYDRSDYKTALKIWQEKADEGDIEAQTYVGEIYEKGLGTTPDYVLAAEWYGRAAKQGYARAQTNLGHLYEKGLGVEKDPKKALELYRKASGLGDVGDAIALDPGGIDTETRQEMERLKGEVEISKQEIESLRQQLELTRQQLEQAGQELESRKSEVEAKQQKLEETLQELERQKQQAEAAGNDAEVGELEDQLTQREAELESQRREVAKLRQDIVNLEGEAESNRRQLSELNEQNEKQRQEALLVGPTIEVIEPMLPSIQVTRGLKSSVETRPEAESLIIGMVTAPAGLRTFTVNDREEKLDAKRVFRVRIPVKRSNVPMKLVAIDNQGKSATVQFLLIPGAKPPFSPAEQLKPTGFGQYHALIIGNEDYDFWPDLKTPANDATKVGKVLEEKYGFKTKVLINATRSEILEAMEEYRKTLTEEDNLLIYYAGHGSLDDKNNRGYWVPVNGKTDSVVEWIPTTTITDFLQAMSVRHILVVADSCYSGALTRSAIAGLQTGMSKEALEHWIETMSKKRSRTVLTSGDLTPVLDAGGGENSVFAKAFLETLLESSEILVGQGLYNQVAARVAYAASLEQEQIPQYAGLLHAGHESGDFLFVPKTAVK